MPSRNDPSAKGLPIPTASKTKHINQHHNLPSLLISTPEFLDMTL